MFVECWHNTDESDCLGFQPFVITHFNTIVLIFYDWLWWIKMRTRVWRVSFSILLLLHRSVKLCLSSDGFDLFNALLNEHFLWSFNIFCASKMWLSFTKNKLPCFLGYFVFVLLMFYKFLGWNGHFTVKMDSSIHDNFISHDWSWTLTVLYINCTKFFSVFYLYHHNYPFFLFLLFTCIQFCVI